MEAIHETFNDEFSERFNSRMAAKSWTPAHIVAALSDRGYSITVQAVMRWADGSAAPKAFMLPPIAECLGCTPNDLVGVFTAS